MASLHACKNDEPSVKYRQFTSDDLSYLHYNKDTLTYTGAGIEYKDTLTYLLNDTGSIYIKTHTRIYSFFSNPFGFTNIQDIFGETAMNPEKKTGFEYANVTISRGSNFGYIGRFFEVGANGVSSYKKRYSETDTVLIDTALVLGKIYQNVLKFYPPEEDKSDIRLIYFAKKYGYIKIEKLDGTKIERIEKEK